MRFVSENVGRPDLSAGLIANRLAVSRSVLYRMFKDSGGVACLIKRQRLLALREALSRPGDSSRVATLARACGFSSAAHAGRSFRAAFGVAPGRYRALHRIGSPDGSPDSEESGGGTSVTAGTEDAVPAAGILDASCRPLSAAPPAGPMR